LPPEPHPHFSGWRVCSYAALTQALAIGFTLGAMGLFARPLGEEFGFGSTAFNVGVGGFTCVMNLSMPVIGRFVDRGSIRGVMSIGALVLALSLVGLAYAESAWQVGVLWILGCALGMAMLGPMPSSAAIANWFDRLRGRALGFANAGAPVGPFIVVPLAGMVIESWGWRPILLVFAAACVAIALPAARFGMIDRPEQVGQRADGDEVVVRDDIGPSEPLVEPAWEAPAILRSVDFWCLAIAAAIFGAQGIIVGANVIPFLQHRGASVELSTIAPMAMGVGAIGGPLLFGPLADRIHPRALFVGLCIGLTLAFGALTLDLPLPGLLGLLLVCGLAGGSMMPVYGALIARLFGVASFGQVMGLAALIAIPTGTFAPIAFGYAFDTTGSYVAGFIGLIVAMGIAVAFFARLPAGPARRR